MVPCPNCKKLCGVRDAVLHNERLYYRCSQCMDCFDVVVALQGTPARAPAPAPAEEGPRPSASQRGPKIPVPSSRYNPVFKLDGEPIRTTGRAPDAGEVTREVTPSLATLIASRGSTPPAELTPTLPVPVLALEGQSPSKTIELDLEDGDVKVVKDSEPTPLQTAPTERPPDSSTLRSLTSHIGTISTVAIFFVAIVMAGIFANDLDHPRAKSTQEKSTQAMTRGECAPEVQP